MKTSDAMDTAFSRCYWHGTFRSIHEIEDPSGRNAGYTRESQEENGLMVYTDGVYFAESPAVVSALEIRSNDRELFASIVARTDLRSRDRNVMDAINSINNDGNACGSSFDVQQNCIWTRSTLCFVGFPICFEEAESEPEPFCLSSPEIEAALNLLVQVVSRLYSVHRVCASMAGRRTSRARRTSGGEAGAGVRL